MRDTTYRDILNQSHEDELPDLDVAALGALELFADTPVPAVDYSAFTRPLVIGSGNAGVIGQALFHDKDALFGNESTYADMLAHEMTTEAVVISSSGGKHAEGIAKLITEREMPLWLFTNTPDAPATKHVDPSRVVLFPKNREPYTYNTSTYMGMLLSKTGEDPHSIYQFIEEEVAPAIPQTLGEYEAFFFLVPERHDPIRRLFITKFEELFGAEVTGRVFTKEEAKHAETVVPTKGELFVSFGEKNTLFGEEGNRLTIPLPEDAGYAAMMAIGYFFIGQIQKQKPPYFKEHVSEYVKEASKLFNQTIPVIVP